MTNTNALASLVLESNNLRGGEDNIETVVASLLNVLTLLSQQSYSLGQLEKVVVTHDGLPQVELDKIQKKTGLDTLHFVEINEKDGYYKAKNIGFEQTTSEVVVFADADCTPKQDWLAQILQPFEDAERSNRELPPVVAGRTTYHNSVLGTAISTMDFIYYKSPIQEGAVRNFYANNVAFRRDVYEKYHFGQHKKIFRGHCQIISMTLTSDGVPIHFQNTAHTIHRFPDTLRELIRLRLLRGQDAVSMTPHIADAALPKSLSWMKKLLPINVFLIFAIRPICGLLQINNQDMPKVSGLRYLVCMFNVGLVNLIDATGALMRLLGFSPLGKVNDGELLAMSYHSNRD